MTFASHWGYVLFDRLDEHGITCLGFYSARYGTWLEWPLQEFFEELAGGAVDLPHERARVWRLLGGSDGDRSRRGAASASDGR